MSHMQHSDLTPTQTVRLPRFLYEGLQDRRLDVTGFMLWAVIHGYAPDQEPGTFSPALPNVTNRTLGQRTGLSRRQLINVLNHLEGVGLIQRLTAAEQATLIRQVLRRVTGRETLDVRFVVGASRPAPGA